MIDNTGDCVSPVRTAKATTRASDVSPLVTEKSVMRIGSFAFRAPVPSSVAAGPMPNTRIIMNTAMSAMNDPSAYMPPRAVLYQLTCGAALSAMVAIVPCTSDGVPPGVYVGVCVMARRITRCTYPVQRMTGRPSAITTSEPGNTQSGSPIPTIAAFASTATTTNAAA